VHQEEQFSRALGRLVAAIEQAAKARGLSFRTTPEGDPSVHLGDDVHVLVRDTKSLLVPSITAIRSRVGETIAVQQFVVTVVGDESTWSSAASATSGLTFADSDFAQILLDQNAW
jgi:hypothetical protein